MTLGEGKRKVLMLLDEYSSGGTVTLDEDLEHRMADYFDLAQKNIASFKRLIRAFVPQAPEDAAEMEPVPCPAPPDFVQVFRVWRDGALAGRYAWRSAAILLPRADLGRVTVEYFAVPGTIPQDAPDSYVFEVAEDAAACMPYYVAAQQLLVDLVVDYRPLLELYNMMLQALDTRLPMSGGGGVRQRLYAAGGRNVPWRDGRA